MHVNFYKNPQIKASHTSLKIEHSVLFLDYLEHFISNSATKRVQGYGTVGLAPNTIRTYKSLFRIVKAYEFENLRNCISIVLINIPLNHLRDS